MSPVSNLTWLHPLELFYRPTQEILVLDFSLFIYRLTSTEPVKDILSICSWSTIALPHSGPSPGKINKITKYDQRHSSTEDLVQYWLHPVENQPTIIIRQGSIYLCSESTSLIRVAQYKAVNGVSSAGFRMTTLPIQQIRYNGKANEPNSSLTTCQCWS